MATTNVERGSLGPVRGHEHTESGGRWFVDMQDLFLLHNPLCLRSQRHARSVPGDTIVDGTAAGRNTLAGIELDAPATSKPVRRCQAKRISEVFVFAEKSFHPLT